LKSRPADTGVTSSVVGNAGSSDGGSSDVIAVARPCVRQRGAVRRKGFGEPSPPGWSAAPDASRPARARPTRPGRIDTPAAPHSQRPGGRCGTGRRVCLLVQTQGSVRSTGGGVTGTSGRVRCNTNRSTRDARAALQASLGCPATTSLQEARPFPRWWTVPAAGRPQPDDPRRRRPRAAVLRLAGGLPEPIRPASRSGRRYVARLEHPQGRAPPALIQLHQFRRSERCLVDTGCKIRKVAIPQPGPPSHPSSGAR
jgi:hypothetical protein